MWNVDKLDKCSSSNGKRRGSLQPHLRGNRERLFKKCPQRFCIPLESILDVNGVLRKGHVILGFTKNGRYLISYCLKIDNDDSSPMPRYAYSLHWWQFHQWRPLVQVFTVPLFDEDEIHEDLHLMVAESPDESQIVVYGEIRCFKEDQSHQCYVTVCAGPSPRPCPVCKYAPLGGITARCLKHSFVVNFKYDLLPPFPLFNPSTNLKMEDTVLFNTGDFLMALRVLTTDGHGNNLPEVLKSLNPDRKDHISNTSCSSLGEQASTANPDIGYVSCQCSDTARGDVNVNVPVGRLSAEDMEVRSNRDVSEESSSEIKAEGAQSTCAMHTHFDRRRIVSGFVDGLNQIHGEQRHAHELTKEECVSHSQHFINEQECQEQNYLSSHDSAPTKECCDEGGNLDKTDGFCNISNLPSDSVQTSKSIANTSCGLHTTETSQCTCSHVLDGSLPFVQNNKELSSICNNSPESDCNGNCDLDFPHKGPDTCTSCSRSVPVPVLNNNNLTSSVFKVYTESIHVPSYHEPTDMADDFDMYDGSLPLTVKTRHGRTLQQVF
ncbi:protein ubiquitination [Desmophyllum pertusum]|uniref:Protein ubiquitination n=1 Tax=Desmophyllum pertusum TaxID=174260 RepID=A0A9X0CXG2_9CNID|nr:protein ubiquitination [Desmophyllum pertusum]